MISVETPVISKKQQKKVLSAKKNAKKETIKNVLTTPYTRYWPLLNENDTSQLVSCLEKCIPKLSETKKIPWSEIKNVAKEQRKEFRQKFLNNETIDTSIRKFLIFGINSVTRKLEKNEASSVLIHDKVSPQFMVKHVINLCVLKSVPCIVVPNLKEILKQKSGMTSTCICLTKESCTKNELKELEELILLLSKNYPIPENHISFVQKETANIESKKLFDDSDFICFEDTKGDSVLNDLTDNNELIFKENEYFTPQNGWYLTKTNNDKRAFIPEIHSLDENTGNVKDTADFMSFNVSSSMEVDAEVLDKPDGTRYYTKNTKKVQKQKGKYIPLKVKRIKGNKNRVKNKLEKNK